MRGGGTGKYASVDGDVPACMLISKSTSLNSSPNGGLSQLQPKRRKRQINHNPNSMQRPSSTKRQPHLNLLCKNVRGLSNDDRLEELLLEALFDEWDILLLSETWRETQREHFTTQDGHVFLGSGAGGERRGVAFLVHKKLVPCIKEFVPVNERMAVLRLKIGKTTMRVMVVYFPHSGYADAEVDKIYRTMSAVHSKCRLNSEMFIVGGDFNAEVSTRLDSDNPKTIGAYGYNLENSRGQWLKSWCDTERLSILNTMFPKSDQHRITYIGPNKRPRQLDYFLIDEVHSYKITDAGSVSYPDMGSDHSAVRLVADIGASRNRRKQKRKTRAADWKNVDSKKYMNESETIFSHMTLEKGLENRCKQIDDALVEAARLSEQGRTPKLEKSDQELRLESMISKRRNIPNHCTKERSDASKAIQKELKAIKKATRQASIKTILNEF